MPTTENSTGTVDETTQNTGTHRNEGEADEEFVVRNRHQTSVPVDGESKDTSEVGPAENRHQTVSPAD